LVEFWGLGLCFEEDEEYPFYGSGSLRLLEVYLSTYNAIGAYLSMISLLEINF